MAYGVIMFYHLHIPSYVLAIFTGYLYLNIQKSLLIHNNLVINQLVDFILFTEYP